MTEHEAILYKAKLVKAMTSKLCPFRNDLCDTSCIAFNEGKTAAIAISDGKYSHEVVVKPYCKLIDKGE